MTEKLIQNVIVAMQDSLTDEQLQKLENVLAINLHGMEVREECTQLVTSERHWERILNLYKLPTVFFVYKPGYLEKDSAVPIPGLYAEDVEQYLPLATRYQNGLIEDWNERAVIPYLIKAIQQQHEEIEALKRKVA